MQLSQRTSVSSHQLEALIEAVERAAFLNGDSPPSPTSQLLDPSCMLEALSDVYTASLQLVRASRQANQGLGHEMRS